MCRIVLPLKDCFVAALFAMTLVPATGFASVAGEVNKANDLYKQNKFDDSLKLYQEALDHDQNSPVIDYDLGTALYKKGDLVKAKDYLEQVAQDKNIKIKPKAEYNLGNVLYKSGIKKENTDVNEAIKSLQEALGHYGQSIAIDPKDQDAIYNQDFVKKEIERLKKIKQQQQQQQNQQQQKNQKQQQQQQDQQNQQGQQNQQNQKDQQKQESQEAKQGQQENQQAQQAQESNPKDQKDQRSASESKADKEKSAQARSEESQKELDRKQAEDLLEEYQENEEPHKLLNYMPKKIDDRPVLKDW